MGKALKNLIIIIERKVKYTSLEMLSLEVGEGRRAEKQCQGGIIQGYKFIKQHPYITQQDCPKFRIKKQKAKYVNLNC